MRKILDFKKYLESTQDAMYDIMTSDDEDPRKIELMDLIDMAEEEDSEDGKSWSESERQRINRKISQLEPDLYNKPEKTEDPVYKKDRLLSAVKSDIEKTIDRIERNLAGETRYKAKNKSAAAQLHAMLSKLKSISKSNDLDAMNNFLTQVEKKENEANFSWTYE